MYILSFSSVVFIFLVVSKIAYGHDPEVDMTTVSFVCGIPLL